LIQGSERPSDYNRALVLMTGLHDAWIAGRGTLASAGTAIKRVTAEKPRILEMTDCVNCGLRDVVVRDSAGFNIHMLHSRNLRMSGYKIINDLSLPNQDGTDPDGCDGVVVSHVFMYTSDDAIAVKADHGRCQHLLIEDCVFWTKKSALKIGSDPYFGAKDVTFRNDHVVHADRALALYSGKGPIEHVVFDHDTSETVGGDAKRMLIIFEVSKAKEHEPSAERRGVGFIRDVVVDHYTAYARSENPSLIAGVVADDGSLHSVANVVFRHLQIAGKVCTSAAQADITIGGKAGARTVANVRFEP
jgi:polygalacturonase